MGKNSHSALMLILRPVHLFCSHHFYPDDHLLEKLTPRHRPHRVVWGVYKLLPVQKLSAPFSECYWQVHHLPIISNLIIESPFSIISYTTSMTDRMLAAGQIGLIQCSLLEPICQAIKDWMKQQTVSEAAQGYTYIPIPRFPSPGLPCARCGEMLDTSNTAL